MILYFSGTGNSRYAAKKIGEKIQDEVLDLFSKIRDRDLSALHSDKPWVIVTPTYGWRIPRIVQEWIAKVELNGSKDIYFVMTCGEGIGNAGAYAERLCVSKGMNYSGCFPVIMPENYIALFDAPTKEQSLEIIGRAEKQIDKIALSIKHKEKHVRSAVTFMDRVSSGIVNDAFYPLFVHAKKFYVTDACISCGKCEKVCPLKNVHLKNGKPVWGEHCTHCMACICRCPREAIEYGRHSKGRVRYYCPKNI